MYERDLFKGILYRSNSENPRWVYGYYLPKAETSYAFSTDNTDGRATPHDFIMFDSIVDWGLPNQVRMVPVIDGSVCINTKLKIRDKYVYINDIIRVYDIEKGNKDYVVKYNETRGEFTMVPCNSSNGNVIEDSLSCYINSSELTERFSISIQGNIKERLFFDEQSV